MDRIKLGSNIRALRNAFGENLKDLAKILNVKENTLSYYERGEREPDKSTIDKISKHYMVTIEELFYSDFSYTGKLSVDGRSFWNNLNLIFPIFSNENALNNPSFKTAYRIHREFFDELIKCGEKNFENIEDFSDIRGYDKLEWCLAEYEKSMKNEGIRSISTANYLGIISLFIVFLNGYFVMFVNKTALLNLLFDKSKMHEILGLIDDDTSIVDDAKQLLSEIFDSETINELRQYIICLKKSDEYTDLAYYYLGIHYSFDIVDNGLEWENNNRIGNEMLKSFASLGNKYAYRYLKICEKSINNSSQNVKLK